MRHPPVEERQPVARPATGEEIHGAFGTVRTEETGSRRSLLGRLLTLLAIIGPGLIVMVGDNDSGGVSTYAAAGQNYGLSLLWTLPLIIPVLIVNQEMVVRLGAVTGVGFARLIAERFGRAWARFSVSCLFLLNVLTISTEFIGITLSLGYFGVSTYLSVPLAAVALIAMTATGSFRRWERFMFVFVVANFLVIPLVVFAHPRAGPIVHGFLVPGIQGGASSTSIVFIIAVIGTTVAPWQLFFQQSNIVDKKITPRWINYERVDTALGACVTVLAATLLIATTAFGFAGHRDLVGHFVDGGEVARALGRVLGHGAGTLFALVLLNASIIGAAAVTLTASYAFGDMTGVRNSLDRSFREAKQFYALFIALVLVAAGIVLIPHAPLGLIVTAVQALAGVLLPSTTVFALLLCNDREVLGPWVNRPWLNALAGVIVAVLVGLSLILIVATAFSTIDVTLLCLVIGGVLAVVLAVAGGVWALSGARPAGVDRSNREHWRMPQVSLLKPAPPSRWRKLVLTGLGGLLVVSIALLLVKSIELGLGH